jgi:hypothetical protein
MLRRLQSRQIASAGVHFYLNRSVDVAVSQRDADKSRFQLAIAQRVAMICYGAIALRMRLELKWEWAARTIVERLVALDGM